MSFKTIEWKDDTVVMIDQRKLPLEEVYVTCRTYEEVAEAIKNMTIRGAPAIGVAAAMGIALGMKKGDRPLFCLAKRGLSPFSAICDTMAATRPTAVNLFWAIERMKRTYERVKEEVFETLRKEAIAIYEEDIAANKKIGENGYRFIPDGGTVMTHCNAGALATAGHGTALGVLYTAKEKGKKFGVLACETRPFLQGARLTAWELQKNGVKVTLITDNMAGSFMRQGKIDAIIVGADRIAANGDAANKIGTYSHACLAKYHKIPFYVAAPTSTIDMKCLNGGKIPIEERPAEEVTNFNGQRIAPKGILVKNPAFDVTPAGLITAIITERGVVNEPNEERVRRVGNTSEVWDPSPRRCYQPVAKETT